MANDSSQIVVAAGGSISVAPVGTAFSTDPAVALSASWRNLGYATEDGVTFGDAPSVQDIMSWQKNSPVRRVIDGRDRTVTFTLEQWNDATFPLAFGGGAWTLVSGSIYKFTPPGDSDALDEKALIVDWSDGDRHFRHVSYTGSVTGGVETQLTRSGAAVLPITFQINANDSGSDWELYSDDPVFAAGGS